MERLTPQIGGDFEAERPGTRVSGTVERLTGFGACPGTWMASGRGALATLLRASAASGCESLLLPSFLCESMVQAVEAVGMPYDFYPVDLQLNSRPEPGDAQAVLVIHYFGKVNPVRDRIHPESIIEDFSMALPPPTTPVGDWWFHSLRKVAAVPLGGWCSQVDRPDAPLHREGSPPRELPDAQQLVAQSIEARRRKWDYLHGGACAPADERAYLDGFAAVERGLDQLPVDTVLPKQAMPWIEALDLEAIQQRRRRHWQILDRALRGRVESLVPALGEAETPLGYVLRLPAAGRDRLRAALAGERIFCPVHWPLPPQVDRDRFPDSWTLSQTLLTLPLDQRYADQDMEWLAGRVLHHLES